MAKKITIELSKKAEKYFNEVAYSYDEGDGKLATHSNVVNYCLETLCDIEDIVGDPVTFVIEYQTSSDKNQYNPKSIH